MGLFGGNTDTGSKEYIRNLEQGKTSYEGYMTPVSDLGLSGYQQMGALLGLSGQGSQQAAYDTFYNTPGIQFAQDEAARATTRQMSAQGYGRSGNVLAALQERSMGLAGQQFNTYLGQLGQFTQPGVQARQNLADMSYNYYGQRGAIEAQQKAAKSAGGFNLGSAIGGAISGFGSGGWMGALGGGLGGGLGGQQGASGGAGMFSGLSSMFGGGGGGSLNLSGSPSQGYYMGGQGNGLALDLGGY